VLDTFLSSIHSFTECNCKTGLQCKSCTSELLRDMQKQCKVGRSLDEGQRSVNVRETSENDGVRVERITQTRERAEFITNRVNLGSCSWIGVTQLTI
jgi:hypothetical protein